MFTAPGVSVWREESSKMFGGKTKLRQNYDVKCRWLRITDYTQAESKLHICPETLGLSPLFIAPNYANTTWRIK